jgi:ATP-binding cassette subfamily F protein 3
MIDFKQISKSYGGQVIFDNISLRINPGDRVGVVGPNGSGKSTLFGLVVGDVDPDQGEVSLPKNLRIGFLKQHLPNNAGLTGLLDFTADAIPELKKAAERLHELEHRMEESDLSEAELEKALTEHGKLQSDFEHLGGYRLRSEAEAALSGLGFSEEAFVKKLCEFSGGWQMRAALARVLISRPDILLLDEPSNYLDIPAVEWLYRFLRSFNGTLLLISHDRYLLKKLTNVTVEINCGHVTRYSGDYDFYRRERENRLLSLEAAKRNQDKKREQLERNIERFRSKSSKASQAQSWIKQLERMEEVVVPDALSFNGTIRIPDAPPCGAEAARFENVSFGYQAGTSVVEDVNLQIEAGDKVAFVGYNGTGKTTLLKLLIGNLTPQEGRIVLGHNIVPGYQAQEFSDILPAECSVYDVVRSAVKEDTQRSVIQAVLGSFGFTAENVDKPCKVLSGGEKIRLCFARIFVNPPNLLILDEPTTHLDIAAREALQQALNDYQGTVCLVSHDIEFIDNVATTVVAMRSPSVRKYYGGYKYYLEKTAAENADVGVGDIVVQKLESIDSSKDRRRERARKRQELAGAKRKAEKKVGLLEKKIEELEMVQTEILEALSAQDGAVDFSELNRRLHTVQVEIERVNGEWEVAAEELEEILQLNREIHS